LPRILPLLLILLAGPGCATWSVWELYGNNEDNLDTWGKSVVTVSIDKELNLWLDMKYNDGRTHRVRAHLSELDPNKFELAKHVKRKGSHPPSGRFRVRTVHSDDERYWWKVVEESSTEVILTIPSKSHLKRKYGCLSRVVVSHPEVRFPVSINLPHINRPRTWRILFSILVTPLTVAFDVVTFPIQMVPLAALHDLGFFP